MADSPQTGSEGALRIRVTSNGLDLPDSDRLISATVQCAANRVPSAKLVFDDGDMPAGNFPLSDSDRLLPGAAICLFAGYGDAPERLIFDGLVVRHGVRIAGENQTRLELDCRHAAVKMTLGRRSAVFSHQTDTQALTQLIQAHGLQADVQGADLHHAQLVQHHCSDWDFVMSRAEAQGLWVVAGVNSLRVAAPDTDATAALTVTWGLDLIEFDASVDAGSQLRGRMRLQGSALVSVGALVELKGVGSRFSGTVLVSALRHDIADGNWTTDVEFGTDPSWHMERPDVMAPAAAGLVPGIAGLRIGVVQQAQDPQGQHRIQVSVPGTGTDTGISGVWARLAQIQASADHGAWFAPQVGDEVVLGWFDNDPAHPVVLGSLYSSQRPPPEPLGGASSVQGLLTRSQCSLSFDDDTGAITLSTHQGNRVVLDDSAQAVTLSDQHGNTVAMSAAGITLKSARDLHILASGAIRMEAGTALDINAVKDVQVEGLNVRLQAQVGLSAKGTATAELRADGQTTIQGALVSIN